jgi:hypothetical protein
MSEKEGYDFFVTKSGVIIDPERMEFNVTIFKPFEVTTYQPLQKAFSESKVKEDTDVLGVALPSGRMLTLIKKQMAYHHVAQGELDNEPWLVSF